MYRGTAPPNPATQALRYTGFAGTQGERRKKSTLGSPGAQMERSQNDRIESPPPTPRSPRVFRDAKCIDGPTPALELPIPGTKLPITPRPGHAIRRTTSRGHHPPDPPPITSTPPPPSP